MHIKDSVHTIFYEIMLLLIPYTVVLFRGECLTSAEPVGPRPL